MMRIPTLTAAMVVLLPALGSAQASLGPEFQVNTYSTGYQGIPSIASDAAGNFIVIWHSTQVDGGALDIFGRRYDASGNPLGSSEFRVNAYTTGTQRLARVASGTNGHAVVVWESPDQDGSADGIFGRQFDPAGVPGPEFLVNSFTTSYQQHPSVAVGGDGRFVVAWQSYAPADGSSWGVFARRYDAAGVAQGGEFLVNSHTTFTQQAPSIASDTSGNFVVVWESYGQDGSSFGIYGQRYDAGGAAAGIEFRVNSYTSGAQTTPSVAMDASGKFVVVWVGDDGSGPGIVGRRFNAAGAPVGPDFTVNSYTTDAQTHPSVSADAGGNFVVAWRSYQDGSMEGVFGRRFDFQGRPEGPDFAVNSFTTGRQVYPSVAAAANGRFVVAWDSYGQDGDSMGVFGQRFEPDLIFQDDFEAGTLAAWSAAATDGGNLSLSTNAALHFTTVGLRGLVNDTASLFVEDTSPSDENRYRARFYFDPNGFDPGEAQGHFRTRIFVAFEEAPTRRLAAVVLRRQNNLYSVRGRCRLDDNSQSDTPFAPITDAPHVIELSWRRSSAPDANDGQCELLVDGTSVALMTDLDNNRSAVDFVRLGALSVKGGASGTIFWDEFVSRRENPIGP
jgi:hypothetical protein